MRDGGGRDTHCCCRLSWREHLVWQPGKGHLCFFSPVWTRVCLCKWPLVENDFWQIGQRCRRCEVVERGMSGGAVYCSAGTGSGVRTLSMDDQCFYIGTNPRAALYGSLHMISIASHAVTKVLGPVDLQFLIASENSCGLTQEQSRGQVGKPATDLPSPNMSQFEEAEGGGTHTGPVSGRGPLLS